MIVENYYNLVTLVSGEFVLFQLCKNLYFYIIRFSLTVIAKLFFKFSKSERRLCAQTELYLFYFSVDLELGILQEKSFKTSTK